MPPSSARQLATLEHLLARGGTVLCIAENGAIVTHDGQVMGTTPVEPAAVRQIVNATSHRSRRASRRSSRRHHVAFESDDDLLEHGDDVLKLDMCATADAPSAAARWLAPVLEGH